VKKAKKSDVETYMVKGYGLSLLGAGVNNMIMQGWQMLGPVLTQPRDSKDQYPYGTHNYFQVMIRSPKPLSALETWPNALHTKDTL